MKKYLIVILSINICIVYAQQFVNKASAENVLVVYRLPYTGTDSLMDPMNSKNYESLGIANHYKLVRGISSENLLPLSIPWEKTIGGHRIKVLLQNEIILDQDGNNSQNHTTIFPQAYEFVKQEITQPIESYLNNTFVNGEPLSAKIRFIVVCKGIPLKVTTYSSNWSMISQGKRMGTSVNSLISLMNQSDPTFSFTNHDFISSTYFDNIYSNPYYNKENSDGQLYNFDFYFKPKTFKNNSMYNLELNYLVSRLDGYNFEDVISMIDRAQVPDMSGDCFYILDGDLNSFTCKDVIDCKDDVSIANINLLSLGFNTLANTTDDVILSAYDEKVIGYQSSGSQSDILLYCDYPVNVLLFNIVNGALFNTYESYNCYVFDVDGPLNCGFFSQRQAHVFQPPHPLQGYYHYQGLISDFIHAGGTGGQAHVFEPTVNTVSDGKIFFPAYAMGYSLVEAIYMGSPYLAYRNVVVGDPLTTIAWGKQTLIANTEWDGTNLVTGKITVPQSKTLTIKEDAVINFRHLGSLEIDGYLIIEKGAKLNFHNGGQLVVNNGIKISGASNKYVEIDFISPNSTTENGIILNESAIEDTLIYVKIKNAYRGITVNEKTLFVNYADITDCATGMYLYRSDYQLTMNEGTKVLNSEISSNQTGIYLNESSPQFISNVISGNNNAVEMINESAPVFGEYLEPGVNTFSDNDYNIVAMNAFPTLGANFSSNIGEDYVGGFNEFTGASSNSFPLMVMDT